jgi:glycosyltransferase involved in cell wall biosynthesis
MVVLAKSQKQQPGFLGGSEKTLAVSLQKQIMLSIIVPTLNEEKYLPLLFRQLKKQDFSDYEVIVADAGSTDRTREIVESFNHRIVKGGNVSQGRNSGAKAAKGDLLLFMDADNIYLPDDFLSTLIKEFKNKKCDIASFPVYADGNRVDKVAFKVYNWWVKSFQRFKAFASNSLIVKKEVFERVGGFDESIKLAEDHEFARRAAKVGKFRFIEIDPVLVSARRMEKEGRLKIYSKYLLAAIYMEAFGPIKTDLFGYWKDNSKKKHSDNLKTTYKERK